MVLEIIENLNEMCKLRNGADYDWKKIKDILKKKSYDCLNFIEYLKNNHSTDLK